jgi:hypothetical protein
MAACASRLHSSWPAWRRSFSSYSPIPPIEASDLTLDDVNLHLSSPTLIADEETVGRSTLDYARPNLLRLSDGEWLYLSFEPHPGYNFQKAGIVESSRAKFTIGGHAYQVHSRSVIGPKPNLNLYVMLDTREPASRGGVWLTWAPNAHPPKNYLELRAGTVTQMLPKL